jgi:hypothetical protein
MYKEDFSDCFETELCSILYKFADLRQRNEPKNLRICGFAIAELKKKVFLSTSGIHTAGELKWDDVFFQMAAKLKNKRIYISTVQDQSKCYSTILLNTSE